MPFLSTYLKKIGAGFILGLLLFIQAEKLLHRHSAATVCHHKEAQCLKALTSGCNICEFQVAREGQLPEISLPAPSIHFIDREYSRISFSTYSDYSDFVSGRGPPAGAL